MILLILFGFFIKKIPRYRNLGFPLLKPMNVRSAGLNSNLQNVFGIARIVVYLGARNGSGVKTIQNAKLYQK